VPSALKLLATAFPRAQFAAGIEPGQLLAWATAIDHEGIQELVDRLNAAPPPEQASKAVVYTLKFVNAAQVVELLTGATPEAKVTADADDPQRLVVWAKPADHTTIESVLQQVDVEGAADSGRTAVIYSLEEMDLRSLIFAFRFLTTSVPDASFSPGAREGQVLAFATAKDHQRIQSLVDQLTKAPPPEQAPAAAVYTVKFITATTASEVLRKAVPKAEFTLDAADTARMTVWASPADQATVKSILEQIDVEGEAGGANVEIYQLEGGLTATSAAYALRLLGTAFPNARFSTGTDPAQIVAWASAKDHAEIKALIDRLNAGPPPEKAPSVVVYNLQFLEAAQAQTVLVAAVPQATLTLDPAAPQRLTVWATPDDHKTIDTVLKQIDIEEAAASDRTVEIYSLRDMNPRSVTYVWRFLAGAVPNARLTPGAEPEQLVAWASAKDHQQLKMLIDQLTTIAPEDEPKIAIYTTKFISAANATQILQLAVPRATLTPDADDPQRLTAWARASDHDNIKSILQEVDVEGDAEAASTVEVYTLQGGLTATSSIYALRLLGTAFPRARFSMGTDPGQIVAWAPARDHADIRALVERLNAGPPDELAPKAEIYTLEFLPAADAVTLLQRAVPGAMLTPDPRDPQRLTVWGTPLEHRSIAGLLKQLDVEIDPANAPTLQSLHAGGRRHAHFDRHPAPADFGLSRDHLHAGRRTGTGSGSGRSETTRRNPETGRSTEPAAARRAGSTSHRVLVEVHLGRRGAADLADGAAPGPLDYRPGRSPAADSLGSPSRPRTNRQNPSGDRHRRRSGQPSHAGRLYARKNRSSAGRLHDPLPGDRLSQGRDIARCCGRTIDRCCYGARSRTDEDPGRPDQPRAAAGVGAHRQSLPAEAG
jgi:hypothetical protein